MSVEPLRHLSVFRPEEFGGRRVDIIGCGATGSRIALSLAKLGVKNIHIHDFDIVESHNLANQAFGHEHVGLMKTDALAQVIERDVGVAVTQHTSRVDGSEALGEVVFLLTDTMSSRKEIWERGLRFRPMTKLLIETRMGADSGRIYSVNPSLLSHIKAWEGTLYEDDEAEVSACGASVSVGPTAELISGLAVWQMIRWAGLEAGMREDELENELIVSLSPTLVLSQTF